MASLTIILDQKEKSHSQTFLTIPKRGAQKHLWEFMAHS